MKPKTHTETTRVLVAQPQGLISEWRHKLRSGVRTPENLAEVALKYSRDMRCPVPVITSARIETITRTIRETRSVKLISE